MGAVQWTVVLFLFVAVAAHAADWAVVYDTDFPVDPNSIADDVQS